MPAVSVIIPNYNHASYLKQRVDTVLNQTYTNIEIIILDDCSTDNSKEVIEQYRSNEKISCIVYNETNSGNTFIQWDKGIQLAKGEYIWIAESDDWCEITFLETIITGLKKDATTVFGYCQSFCVDDKNGIIFQSNYIKLEDYIDKKFYLENFLTHRNAVFNASMAVFKKQYYYKVSSFYKSLRFTGDWIFWAELSRMGTVYVNAKPLNFFRKHVKDVSSKMYSSGNNFIEEIKTFDYFKNNLCLNKENYKKAKIKIYARFLTAQKKIDASVKEEIKLSFFRTYSTKEKLATQFYAKLFRLYHLKTIFR